MLCFNGEPMVSSLSLINHFQDRGRNTDLLSMANSQQFKYIDGAGEGGFLALASSSPSGKFAILTASSQTTTMSYQLLIKDRLVFNIGTADPVVFVKTAELKSILEDYYSLENYNVIDARSVEGEEGYIVHPDRIPKTFKQIVEDRIDTVTVEFEEEDIPIPYNFFVQGKNFLEVTDLYCKAYGLLWTLYNPDIASGGSSCQSSGAIDEDNNNLILKIFRLTALDPNPSKLSDLNFQHLPKDYNFVRTVHPVVDCCLKSPQLWRSKENTDDGIKPREIYCPYYPAILDPSSTAPIESGDIFLAPIPAVTNYNFLDECSEYIKDNLNSFSKLENHYFVNYFIKPIDPSLPPQSIELTFAHNGHGYRSCFFSGKYLGIPVPVFHPFDKQARNVIGKITYTYKKETEDIENFFVTPVYGLDGWIDTEIDLYVLNLYKWDYGVEDAWVRIEWECNMQRWIPLQQEYVCPDDTVYDPLPEPSDEEPKITLDWKE